MCDSSEKSQVVTLSSSADDLFLGFRGGSISRLDLRCNKFTVIYNEKKATCVDHFHFLPEKHLLISRDINGKITSFDARMPNHEYCIFNQHHIPPKSIKKSRFWVSPDETILCSLSASNASNPNPSQSSAELTIWSLSSPMGLPLAVKCFPQSTVDHIKIGCFQMTSDGRDDLYEGFIGLGTGGPLQSHLLTRMENQRLGLGLELSNAIHD